MNINQIQNIRKKSRITVYGSLKKAIKKISKKGMVFYILYFSNRSYVLEAGLQSDMYDLDSGSLVKKMVNRINLKVIPYKYYIKNVSSLKYNKRKRNRLNSLHISRDIH